VFAGIASGLEDKAFPRQLFEPVSKEKIEFTSHSGNLALVRRRVRTFLEPHPFSEKDRLLMVLGVDEACTNIIRYAYALRDDQIISLSMEIGRGCVRIRLRDYGKQAGRDALRRRASKFLKPGGLGLHLIRNAFDKVDYKLKECGTELVLMKKMKDGASSRDAKDHRSFQKSKNRAARN
jgi:anti-sigma regulatory factor (Ser/Thr protein kinase)